MRIVYGAILGFFLAVLFVYSYRKERDFLSPMCVFSAFQLLRYVPNIMFGVVEFGYALNEANVQKVFLMEFLFVLFVVAGYIFYDVAGKFLKQRLNRSPNRKPAHHLPNLSTPSEKVSSLGTIYVLYGIGLLARLFIIVRSGGLAQILSNTGEAYISLSRGMGYVNSLMYLVFLSFFMMAERVKVYNKKSEKIVFFGMMVLYIASDLIFSHRSTTFTIILIVFFAYNYLYRKIQLRDFISAKFIIVLVFSLVVMMGMPLMRSGSFDLANYKAFDGVTKMIDRFSMVGRDAFVYEHFEPGKFWLGKSYLNFFAAPVPSTIWAGKPAVDDGMYLVHLINGYEIAPNASVADMIFRYSIPFTPQGLLYANFGIIGLFAGAVITGALYKHVYKRLKTANNIFSIAWYRVVIIEFALTTGILVATLLQYVYIRLTQLFTWLLHKRKSANHG